MVVFGFGQDEFGDAQRRHRDGSASGGFSRHSDHCAAFCEGVFHQLGHLAGFSAIAPRPKRQISSALPSSWPG